MTNSMKCPQCGEAVESADIFCGNCDYRLQASAPVAHGQSQPLPDASQSWAAPWGAQSIQNVPVPASPQAPNGHQPELSKPAKIIAAVLIAPVGLVVIFFGFLAVTFYTSTSQISKNDADKTCQNFYQDVQSQINAVPGYQIVRGGKSCSPQQDEMNATDYGLSVYFRVSKNDNTSATITTTNIKYLASALPKKDYPVTVTNIAGESAGTEDLCVEASRYLNNDGKDYPQGEPTHTGTYIKAKSIPGYVSPCDGI